MRNKYIEKLIGGHSILANLYNSNNKYCVKYENLQPMIKTYRSIKRSFQTPTISGNYRGLTASPINTQVNHNQDNKPIMNSKINTRNNPFVYAPIDPSLSGIPSFLPFGLNTYISYPDLYSTSNMNRENKKEKVLKMNMRIIHKLENDRNIGMHINNNQDTIWTPYNSFEGGAKTIHDGLKLNEGTRQKYIVDNQGYLTNDQAKELVYDNLSYHYDYAKSFFNNAEGDRRWDDLSDNEQMVLTDYAYNGVIARFPKLIQGMKNKDANTILNEYKRYSNGKELKERNYETEKILQLIAIEYNNSSNLFLQQ